MVASVTVRAKEDASAPIATLDAIHIQAAGADYVDETDNSINRFYLSAEHDSFDAARSPEFEGDFLWDDWIPPVVGLWTIHLRQASDDAAVAQDQFTASAP